MEVGEQLVEVSSVTSGTSVIQVPNLGGLPVRDADFRTGDCY